MRDHQEAEFRDYVAAHADRLRRFAYLCCGDWHRAEDAVQTAFVRLYDVWTKTSEMSCDHYVRRIVTNILIDEHRRGWFRRERASDALPEQSVPDGSQRSVETLMIMDALAKLPPRQRAVVILRYWEDLSVEQVSEILRCSTGTVKSQSARALQALRAQLADSTQIKQREGHHDRRHQGPARSGLERLAAQGVRHRHGGPSRPRPSPPPPLGPGRWRVVRRGCVDRRHRRAEFSDRTPHGACSGAGWRHPTACEDLHPSGARPGQDLPLEVLRRPRGRRNRRRAHRRPQELYRRALPGVEGDQVRTGGRNLHEPRRVVRHEKQGKALGSGRRTVTTPGFALHQPFGHEGGQIVHEQPVYRFRYPGAVNEDTLHVYSGIQIAVDGSGADQIDLLRVALYPAGGFRIGYDPSRDSQDSPVNGYLVKGCDTYDKTDAHEETTADDRRFSFDCTESTGPNGERIFAVASHVTYLDADLTYTIHTVVVHRTDGTAVVVSDTATPGFNWSQGKPTSATTSGLSIEALTGLALAVPIVPIG